MYKIGEEDISNIGGIFNYISNDEMIPTSYENIISTNSEDWTNKTISTSTGAETSSSTRLIPINSIKVEPLKVYTIGLINDNYELFNLHAYNSSNVWIEGREHFNLPSIAGYRTVNFTVPSDTEYIKVVIRKSGNEEITAEDIKEVGIVMKEG